MRKVIATVLAAAVAVTTLGSVAAISGCSSSDNKIATPENYTMTYDEEYEEVDYSFSPVDGAAYYYIRVYAYNPLTGGIASDDYLTSTRRLRLSDDEDETIEGTLDVSDLGWGEYMFNLYAYPSDTSMDISEPATIMGLFGDGGKLEQPELFIEVTPDSSNSWGYDIIAHIDGISIYTYFHYQTLQISAKFWFYSDEACTDEIWSFDWDGMGSWSQWDHPAAGHYVFGSGETSYDQYDFTDKVLDGTFQQDQTYYAKCQVYSNFDFISDSEVSTVCPFTVKNDTTAGNRGSAGETSSSYSAQQETARERTCYYSAYCPAEAAINIANWCVDWGTYGNTDAWHTLRTDYWGNQTTTNKLVVEDDED